MQHKKINNLEAVDVYCFGHLLFEMMFGTPLHESIVEDIPDCPISEFYFFQSNFSMINIVFWLYFFIFLFIENILTLILSSEACKNGLPTIQSLISDPFFANVQLKLLSTDKAHLKIPNSTKDHLKKVVIQIEERLKGEQKVVRSQKRLARVQEMMSSEEEKKKYRHKLVRN